MVVTAGGGVLAGEATGAAQHPTVPGVAHTGGPAPHVLGEGTPCHRPAVKAKSGSELSIWLLGSGLSARQTPPGGAARSTRPAVPPVHSFITQSFAGRRGPNCGVVGATFSWRGEVRSASASRSRALVELNLALKPESNVPFKGESSPGP